MENITLLIVDDIPMNRDMVRNIFKDDYKVLEASNGVEAMEIIKSTNIEILITDIFMEPMNGYELIANMRSKVEYKKIPIIAITESDHASRKKALQAGADDLIYKPFISSILHNRVKGLLFDGFDLNRYKLAYENNPIAFVLYHVIDRPDTPSYKIMYMNRAARESFSPPYIEYSLKTDENPDVCDFLLKAIRSSESLRKSFFEPEIQRWVDWTVYPDGTGLVAAMVHDITEEIERQTKKAKAGEKQAIQQRNSIIDIVENIPGGIFVFDVTTEDMSIVEVNSSGCKILDIDQSGAIGVKKEKILSFLHPDDIPPVMEAMNKLSVPETDVTYECRIFNRKKEKYTWFSAQAHSKTQPDGKIFAFINYVDITLEKELFNTRTELLAAKKANHAKTEFMSRVSHDMRTPLNGILGLTTLMKDDTTDSDMIKNLNQLQMSGEYLLNLITDTLDVNKIEEGKLELHPSVCDGRTVFNTVLSLAKPNLQSKNIHFNLKADNLPFTFLYIDVGRCEQIVMNILGNAIKFTPEGGTIDFIMENVSVTDTVITDRVTIKDNGIGMSKEFLPQLFEPFSQENQGTTSTSAGTGLGMTIVKQIIELMGGEISVESELGKGTTFSFLIPMQIATEKQVDEWKKTKATVYSGDTLEKKRVLLCEDHPLNTIISTRLLNKKGMIVEHAENGAQGLEMFEKSDVNYYDIVLMDIRMPIMDGFEATQKIRALERTDAKTVPIVAMTANAFEQDINQTREVGMNAHLSKPIDTQKLYTTLESMLRLDHYYKKSKILIVDDMQVNREVLRATLEDTYTILEATDGSHAIKMLEENKGINMVITDIQMPNMDGIELIRKMRSNKAYNHIKIMANTQYGTPQQEEELLSLGANEFIYKPSTPHIIRLRVKNSLSAN